MGIGIPPRLGFGMGMENNFWDENGKGVTRSRPTPLSTLISKCRMNFYIFNLFMVSEE